MTEIEELGPANRDVSSEEAIKRKEELLKAIIMEYVASREVGERSQVEGRLEDGIGRVTKEIGELTNNYWTR